MAALARGGSVAQPHHCPGWQCAPGTSHLLRPAQPCISIRSRPLLPHPPPTHPQTSDETLSHIFGSILSWHLAKRGFPPSAPPLAGPLVAATLQLYRAAAARLLPTPAKSHYLFNLRDFARVVQASGGWELGAGGALAGGRWLGDGLGDAWVGSASRWLAATPTATAARRLLPDLSPIPGTPPACPRPNRVS
jgi:hypothetical protein